MLISLNWLNDYIKLDVELEQLCKDLTMLGLEIEKVEHSGADITELYIGKILSIESHPDADNLVICKTDIGQAEPLQIVCGAKNMKAGDLIPTVAVGGTLPGDFKIAKRKMRGIESQGMMCSAKELGLGENHEGLMILSGDLNPGMDAKSVLGLDDVILEIEVTPNRADWAGMIGVARELAARYEIPLLVPEVKLTESNIPVEELSSVTNEATELCPRYMGRVLQNVKVAPSPQWLQKYLIAAGQRPINNIVDITNFVLLETGHPLHAFDLDKLAENRIIVRKAASSEPINTLDEESRKLTDEMLVIADAKQPQCIAGVIGGADSEVGDSTTKIFLECAYFSPSSVRATSRALNVITESSQRFQRGADPEMCQYAINRAAGLIQDIAEAEVTKGIIDSYPKEIPVRETELRYERCRSFLGAEIENDFQTKALEKLGFEVISKYEASFHVKIPTWRGDVTMEADLIEEIARLYNFDNIPNRLPNPARTEKVYAPLEKKLRNLRDYLISLGLTECYNWTFMSNSDIEEFMLEDINSKLVQLANPLSENYAGMRTTLIPGIIRNIRHNVTRGAADLCLFEIGPVYYPDSSNEEKSNQDVNLTIAITGNSQESHWSNPSANYDFFDIKGYTDSIGKFFGSELEYKPVTYKCFQSGQSAEILLNGNTCGNIGRINNPLLKKMDIEQPVYLAEIKLKSLLKKKIKQPAMKVIPSYPASFRDMALVVDSSVKSGDLVICAEKSGGKLLNKVSIFDIYTGEHIEKNQKSVGLRLKFQANDRTLTDNDTQKSFNKILKQTEKQYGAILR